MYKIRNNLVPDYLKQIFQVLAGGGPFQDTIHVTQVIILYQSVDCKFLKKSFVPDVINQWNLLQIEAREATYLTNFKKHINRNIPKPPNYFSAGNRKDQYHTY